MPKIDKDNSAGREDRRRHNKTPVHSRVKQGQVLNPHGRAGKPKDDSPTSLDGIYLEEARRVVSREGDREIEALRRLVQEEFHSALKDKDAAVRGRLLSRLQEADIRQSREDREFVEHVRLRKDELSVRFYRARRKGAVPPDVLPHPDHVVFKSGWPAISGPVEPEDRRHWENIKGAIRMIAYLHQAAREEYRRVGTQEVADELEALAKRRRQLMRKVPKGWNWREEIYCRDSMLEVVKDAIRQLKEIGYVPTAS